MRHFYLEVTYRKGKALAAYYYLPRRKGDRSTRTEKAEGGFVVDYAADGRPIGIEITSPSRLEVVLLNRLLERIGQKAAAPEDLAPLVAA